MNPTSQDWNYRLDVDTENLIYAVVELSKDHPVPTFWNSQDDATGYARILLNGETGEIYKMEMIVDGISVSGGENSLQDTPLQSFHFHNLPQVGNPNFFVQQLYDADVTGAPTTATLENTASGLRFSIDETYQLRPPVNNPNLDVAFVIDEILAGSGYLGVHTANLPIPATAIAGDMVVLSEGGLDGVVLYLGDDDDLAIGSLDSDLISAGGGDDTVRGLGGDDVLDSGAGDDLVVGNRGDDVLYGGVGDDTLFGGRGDDALRGGGDADVFGYRIGDGADTILDFQVGEDALLLFGAARDATLSLVDADGDGASDDTRLEVGRGRIDLVDVDLTALETDIFLA
jgi:Ca2+-binding RTX toxin-like protein